MSDIADRIKKKLQSSRLFGYREDTQKPTSTQAPIEDVPDAIDQMSNTPPSGIAPRGDGNIMVPNVQQIRKGLRSDQRTRGGEKDPIVERQRYESPTLPELPEPKPDELFAPGGPHGPDSKGILPGRRSINPFTQAKGKAAMVPTAVGMGVAGKAAASAIGAKGLIGTVGPYAPFALVAAHIINSRLNRPKPRSVGPGGYLRAAEYMKEQGNTKDPYGQDWKIVTDPDTGTRYVQDPAAMKNYGQTIMASLDEGSLEKYRSDYAHTTRGQGIVQNLGYDMDKRHAHEQYINRGRHGLPSESQQRESGMPFDPGPPEGHDLSPSGRTADDIMAQGLKTGRGFDSKFGYANIDYGAA